MKKCALILTSLLFASQAQAVIITGEFRGTVYESYTQLGGEDVYNGEELVAHFTYNTELAQLVDRYSSNDEKAAWEDSGNNESWVEVSYTVGGHTYEITPYEDGMRWVYDNVQVQDSDADGFKVAEYYSNFTNRINYAYISLLDYTGTLLDSTDAIQSFNWEDINTTFGNCSVLVADDDTCGWFYAHDYKTNAGAPTETYHKVLATMNSGSFSVVNEVPEPATLLLMSLGVVGLALMGRRRSQLHQPNVNLLPSQQQRILHHS